MKQSAIAPLELDFRARPSGPLRQLAWALLLLASCLLVWLTQLHNQADARVEQLESKWQRLQVQAKAQAQPGQQRRASARVSDAESLRRIQHANRVIDELSLPWEALFQTVEAANAGELGLLSLAPNPQNHVLRLSGEAKTIAEVLAYVHRLGQQPMLKQAHLTGYETVQREGVNVIRFSVAAGWEEKPQHLQQPQQARQEQVEPREPREPQRSGAS